MGRRAAASLGVGATLGLEQLEARDVPSSSVGHYAAAHSPGSEKFAHGHHADVRSHHGHGHTHHSHHGHAAGFPKHKGGDCGTPPAAGTGAISGTVYNDRNLSGAFDSGDALLAGAVIQLTGQDVSGNSVSVTATTDASGFYQFANLVDGSYVVVEVSTPDGSSTSNTYNVDVVNGSSTLNIDFVNAFTND